jgi:histidine triad (HIT) family protein
MAKPAHAFCQDDTVYSHEPENYNCPLCGVVSGSFDALTQKSDIVYETEHVTAWIAPGWWPNNPGHVIIVPNRHIENIYVMPAELHMHLYEAARQVAIALKQVYGCEGTSTRQHNEPAGYQEVWHYHLHVFPRYHNDRLYELTPERRWTAPEERIPYAEKLRRYFNGKHL